jgi:Na+/melibiose symporter-like transporter
MDTTSPSPAATSAPATLGRRVGIRLGLPDVRGHGSLILALGASAAGAGLAGPILLLYLTRVAGLALGYAGLVLTASGLVALTVPAFSSLATRRTGPLGLVVAAQGLQAAGTAGLAIATVPDRRPTVLLAACCLLLAVGQRAFWSSIFAVLADVADAGQARARTDPGDHSREEWFALAGMLQGAGFSVGALVGGALLAAPGTAPYITGMVLGATAFVFSGLLLARSPARSRIRSSTPPRVRILQDRPYLMLIVVNTLFALCSTVLGVGLSLYVVDGLSAPAWLIGPLLALNTLLGATCQGLAVRRTARFRRTATLAVGGLLWLGWGLATASLSLGSRWLVVPGLVVTVVIYSIAELIHAPLSMGLAADSAPSQARAEYLAWFQYSFAVATMAAPGLFAVAYSWGPATPWLVTSAIAAVASAGILALDRPLRNRTPDRCAR